MTYIERASQNSKPKIAKRPAAQPASLGGRLTGLRDVRLIFFGTEDFSCASLEKLIVSGWNVAAVVTKPDSKSGRGQKISLPVVKKIANKHGIKVLQPENITRAIYQIANLEPSLGVLVSYGKLIPQALLDIFPGGIINVHPSLLPAWRGPSPIESALAAGDTETGISLMQLTAGMDEGPVYAQRKVVIHDNETSPELYERLADYGANLLVEKLPQIMEGSLAPESQNDARASYSKLLKKDDGRIDWTEPAEVYERQVRAYQGFPKSTAKVGKSEVIITQARVARSTQDGALVMQCQPGYLEIQELIGPSGKTMSGADFKRGYRSKST